MDVLLKLKNKRLVIGGLLLVLLVLGGLAFMRTQYPDSPGTQATQSIKTTEVTSGDLIMEISGTGSIVAPNAIDLVFSTDGKVAELNVNPGKSVEEGDVLARLDKISTLQLNVEKAKLELTKAQNALDDLEENKEVALANALLAKSEASENLENAQKNEVNKYSPRCEKATTEEYYFEYMYDRSDYLYWYNAYIKKNTGYGEMYILERMAPYKKSMNQNFANWKYCEGYSDLEIEQSQVAVEKAQAEYDQAAAYYESLLNNDGIDPDELALATIERDNAQLQYDEAVRILDGATLTSPMDGTVLSVASAVGEILDKESFNEPYIEIADLSEPILKAVFDESDLASINTECEVQATFESYANQTFQGRITQIDPTLIESTSAMSIETNNADMPMEMSSSSSSGSSSVKTYISIDTSTSSEDIDMPVGLSAVVELSCKIASNVTQVPLQALKNEKNGKAEVYVLNDDGTMTAHTVEVGLRSLTAAEIIGNVQVGDRIVTSSIP